MHESKKNELEPIETRVKHDEDILALVVFGSFARDEEYNDIDVCLFLYPDKISSRVQKIKEYLDFNDKYDLHFFSDLPLYIKIRVLEDGYIIVNKDYDVLFDVYIDTIKEWNLFEPHYNTFLEAFRNE